ncbi:MAG: hypothetical protein WCW87_00065 [Candidatus Paceibacterota bacterium]
MEFIKKFKNLIIGVVAVIILFMAYLYFFPKKDASSSDLLVSQNQTDQSQIAEGQEILSQLNNLSKISLDTSIFQSEIFMSLSDFSVTIPDQPVGRRNPFLPIGQGEAIAPSTASLSAPSTAPKNQQNLNFN